MILRSLNVRVPLLCLSSLWLPLAAPGQQPPPPATPEPTTQQPPQLPAAGKNPSVPDYPDPRTLTIGVWGWGTVSGSGPDLRGGQAATGYETLKNLGKNHITPGVEASLPVTRTAEIHFEGFQSKGDGTQAAPADTTLFSTAYAKGDVLSTQYQIRGLKLAYEDLFYPFKFPVAKFRVRTLWEVQYVAAKATIDAPLKSTTDSSGNLVSTSSSGSRTIILPTFGMAAEYAIAPHVLLRGAGSGFGLPHRAEMWDAEGTIAYRLNNLEIRGGFKILHFKSSPKIDEYMQDTLQGGFVGIRYHWKGFL